MKPGVDWLFPYYRDRALCLGLGVTPLEMLLTAVGAKAAEASAGRQMPSHWGSRRLNIFTTSSPTGSECLPGVGAAEAGRFLARPGVEGLLGRRRRVSRRTRSPSSRSATARPSEGEFWEALNAACTRKLPVVFLVEDNGFAISTPVEVNTPGGSISKVVRGYPGLFLAEVDGCDFLASYDALRWAFAYCRERKGPALVHAHVVRPYSHSLSDDDRLYRTEEERRKDAELDPLARMEALLVEHGLLDAAGLAALKAEVDAEVRRRDGRGAREPAARRRRALRPRLLARRRPDVAGLRHRGLLRVSPGAPTTMVDLINAALKDEMRRDGRIVVCGEDVADATRAEALAECKGKGGVFKVTAGLQKAFGGERVFNSPARRGDDRRDGDRLGGARPEARRRDPVLRLHLARDAAAARRAGDGPLALGRRPGSVPSSSASPSAAT